MPSQQIMKYGCFFTLRFNTFPHRGTMKFNTKIVWGDWMLVSRCPTILRHLHIKSQNIFANICPGIYMICHDIVVFYIGAQKLRQPHFIGDDLKWRPSCGWWMGWYIGFTTSHSLQMCTIYCIAWPGTNNIYGNINMNIIMKTKSLLFQAFLW